MTREEYEKELKYVINGEQEPKAEWIPVSERLPEVGQDVLFSVGDMYTAEGCLREDGDWAQFRWNSVQRKEVVTAWKMLPEPYKESEASK